MNVRDSEHIIAELGEKENYVLTDILAEADLILVMSQNQQKHIEQTWPFAKGKTFRLGHWQGKNIPESGLRQHRPQPHRVGAVRLSARLLFRGQFQGQARVF